jgi:hypothetical protein
VQGKSESESWRPVAQSDSRGSRSPGPATRHGVKMLKVFNWRTTFAEDFERILEIATKYFTAIPSVAAVCIAIPKRACSKVFLPVLQNANTRNTFLAITGSQRSLTAVRIRRHQHPPRQFPPWHSRTSTGTSVSRTVDSWLLLRLLSGHLNSEKCEKSHCTIAKSPRFAATSSDRENCQRW